MKAVAIEVFGGPAGLAVVDLPEPAVAAGQVLVRTEAIGVGGVDAMIRSGAYAAYGFRQGHVPGGEVAGTVVAVGAGVDEAWSGRRVWAFAGVGGGYAEYVVAPAGAVVELPEGFSAFDAVTLGGCGAVARFALRHVSFRPGESVLVRGAAGGIGVMAVQLAARAGAATVAVTTSSAERGRRLRELGADQLVDSCAMLLVKQPAAFDVVVDVVAGPDLPAFLGRLGANGRMVVVGTVGGEPPARFGMELFAAFRSSPSFATFSTNTVAEAERNAAVAEIFGAARAGRLRPVLQAVLPLAQAAEAHRMMDAGEVFGRLALAA